MRVLVISDTHGNCSNLERLLKKTGPFDALIHLGDVERDEDYIRCLVDCPAYFVRGNNDFFSELPAETVLSVGSHRIFMTHGHMAMYYHSGLQGLRDRARELNASVVLFGHTHIPFLDRSQEVTLMNPGSLSRPRQEGHKPSYGWIETDRFGDIHFTLGYLEEK